MPAESVMDELFRYIGFDEADAEALVRARPIVTPSFPAIVDDFYAAISRHPEASAVFVGGEVQIERQKDRLRDWLAGIFGGIYDAAYYARRARIGRVHVQIGLEQRYMFGAMSLVRSGLHRALDASESRDSRAPLAIDRICDIELAIMLESYRERYVERQRAIERLATIGQVAASIGHELRNPLAVMETSLHLARRRATDENVLKHLDRIGEQTVLCASIVSGLLDLARDRQPSRALVGLRDLATEAVSIVRKAEHAQIEIEIAGDLPPIALDHAQMRQVIANLVTNAVQASAGGTGRVRVLAGVDDASAWIEVIDNGPGFSAEMLDRAFEPLVSGRAAGIGLGLALCARIVERHGGSIDATNRAEGGARVRIVLPRIEP
jgi:two-component system, NtrC family, sensor histidine kinase HydH